MATRAEFARVGYAEPEHGFNGDEDLAARTASTAIRVWIAIHTESFAQGYAIYILSASTLWTLLRPARRLLEVADLQVVLGKRIRELRSKKGFSQESFADHCGIHRTYMGGIERGEHNLTIRMVMTVSKALGISMSELLIGIEKLVEPAKRGSKFVDSTKNWDQ